MKQKQLAEIQREKEVYQKQYKEMWEADVQMEKMNAEKRKKKLLEHRHEVSLILVSFTDIPSRLKDNGN